MTEHRRKLIEVALPLDEINAASKAYKDRKVGTIRNIHKWFAPMPLPAWRALLFAALIDDPESDDRRVYLLDLIKRLVANGADLPDAAVVREAKALLQEQFGDALPTVLDPFAGAGSTLVEAQRLGLPTLASDLNPVAVVITRTLTELLPRLSGTPALRASLGDAKKLAVLPGITSDSTVPFAGLIADVLHYANEVTAAAWTDIGGVYTSQPGATSVAWLWARTVRCPNPACGIETVLTTSWWLSKKKGDLAWVEPKVANGKVHLAVVNGQSTGGPPDPPKVGRGASFVCLGCSGVIDETYICAQGLLKRLGLRIVAHVTERVGRRYYRSSASEDNALAPERALDEDFLSIPLPDIPRWFSGPRFGFTKQQDLYTPRQARVLASFAEQIRQVPSRVAADGGTREQAIAITTILGLALGKLAQANSTVVRWNTSVAGSPKAEPAFGRNDMPLLWDFAETFPFGTSVGSFKGIVRDQVRAFKYVVPGVGRAIRADARSVSSDGAILVATDPPYFDAIGYADLSDFFYVWHRQALRSIHPDLYSTLAAPRTGELTAVPAHHGGSRERAKDYFVSGFTETFGNLSRLTHESSLPMIVVYASKEQKGGNEEETRWASILTAMAQAELEITGTWPIHGTTAARMIGNETNAVATYVAMVCRPRAPHAGTCSLGDFNRSLRRELKSAVHALQSAGILPVDLAQAAMGPGMQVYSRYRQVLDQSGMPVPVKQALRLINAALGEVLDEQEGELDSYSRFAVAWWERHGWRAGSFGEADQLARPQGLSVDDVKRAGVIAFPRPGFVAALGAEPLDRSWRPSADNLPTAWEAVHHLADRLIDGGGAIEAGRLMGELETLRDPAQALVYRLHDIAARQGRTKDQERYNSLIGSWSDLIAISTTEKDGLF